MHAPTDECQTATNRNSGEIRRRSPTSLVRTACAARSAQTATWASTISEVPVRANRRPTAVASGPSSAIRCVLACRMSRVRRACREGFRITCASAVAGMVTGIPRSLARARSARTRRSLRSRAMSPPASKVTPFRRPSFCLCRNLREMAAREWRRPSPFPRQSADHLFAGAHRSASLSILLRRKERLPQRASRTRKRWQPLRPQQANGFPRFDHPEG